jgi:hypothetical protein
MNVETRAGIAEGQVPGSGEVPEAGPTPTRNGEGDYRTFFTKFSSVANIVFDFRSRKMRARRRAVTEVESNPPFTLNTL